MPSMVGSIGGIAMKISMVVLYNHTQRTVDETFVVNQKMLFVVKVPASFHAVMIFSMKGNPRLALEKNRVLREDNSHG